MEPLSELELDKLLRQWNAPGAPSSLAAKVLPARTPWWRWLLTGTIRLPVPLGVALLVVLALFLYFRPVNRPETAQPTRSVSLGDFQPVKQLEPRIIRSTYESN